MEQGTLRGKPLGDVARYWKNYITQSVFATITIFFVFLILGVQEAAIIASVGATTFIIFALPEKFTARPRNVIGGHLVGLLCGLLGTWIIRYLPMESMVEEAAAYAVAVGLAMFIMVVTNTEHPPAAGTALGVAITGFSMEVAGTVILFAVLLSFIRRIFRRYLRDLA